MSLQTKINEELKAAMLSQNAVVLSTLRGLKSAISNAALNLGNIQAELSDLEILTVVRKQIKQREDSLAAFKAANRTDLADKESSEISILEAFLPKALTDAEIDQIIQSAITETGATSKKQMGLAIKRAVELAAGRVDNKTISSKIGALLS